MLDTLASSKLVDLFLVDGLVLYVALVTCHNDGRILANLVDQLFVPGRGTLEGILISHIVHK